MSLESENVLAAPVQRSTTAHLVLFVGVLVVSTAAIFINLAQHRGASPLTIAAGRLTFAAILLTPYALKRHKSEIVAVSTRDRALALLGGGLLAVHFASWITSLTFTSVASSTALVSTNPLFVGLASVVLFHERIRHSVLLGIALTIAGSALIGLSDRSGGHGSQPLLGDLLALVGAITASGYFLVGRELRKRLGIVPYIWMVYSIAAVVLLLWMALAGDSLLGLPAVVYGLLFLLALGPQLTGHTAFNWCLKHLSATFVTVAVLGEPVGSALLALLLLPNQQLAVLQIIGGLVLVAGIGVVSLAEQQER
ncbi:MAG: DMT family transporter [Herpetosiphonaceae bacterium]|nr:DMT family transporter [Herpetosiphonaceae bacterium]